MGVSVRSYLVAGVSALAAAAIALPPSIAPPVAAPAPAPVHAKVRLTAQSLAPTPKPVIALVPKPRTNASGTAKTAAVAPPVTPKAAVTATAAPPTAAALALPGLSNAIIDGYEWVIGWVDYGVDLAQYAVGWIPIANIFAPQIGIFYYNLIRPIITSAVYNTAYVIGGNINLIQGISNVINDSIQAGRGFVQAEINWALSWLPPLPPLPFAAPAAKTTAVTAKPNLAAAAADTTKGETPATAEDGAATDEHVKDQTKPDETKPDTKPEATTKDGDPAAAAPQTPATADQPAGATPATEPDTKPDTKKPDTTETGGTTKPDTKPDAKPEAPKADHDKADSSKADTDKPAPKNTEPKKKKRDHRSSTPKADADADAS